MASMTGLLELSINQSDNSCGEELDRRYKELLSQESALREQIALGVSPCEYEILEARLRDITDQMAQILNAFEQPYITIPFCEN